MSGPIWSCLCAVSFFQSPAVWKSFAGFNESSFNLFALSTALYLFTVAQRSEHTYKLFFLTAALAITNVLSLAILGPLIIVGYFRGRNGKRFSLEVIQIILIGLSFHLYLPIATRFGNTKFTWNGISTVG